MIKTASITSSEVRDFDAVATHLEQLLFDVANLAELVRMCDPVTLSDRTLNGVGNLMERLARRAQIELKMICREHYQPAGKRKPPEGGLR